MFYRISQWILFFAVATYEPGWNDPPSMDNLPPTTGPTIKPRLNLNKRVAFPVQSGTATTTSQTVQTTAEGLPLPFSTAKYDPSRIFNPIADATATSHDQLPTSPPSATPLLPPPTSSTPPTAASLAQPSATTTPPTTSSLPPSASDQLTPPLTPPQEANTEANIEPIETIEFDSSTTLEYCQSIFKRSMDAIKTPYNADKLDFIRKRLDVMEDMWNRELIHEPIQKVVRKLASGE